MSDKRDEDIIEIITEAAEAIGGHVMSDVEFARVREAMESATSERDDQARAEGQRFLDEEQDRNIVDGWYDEAEAMTLATLPTFLESLTQAYHHDYGTICHAIAAAALAAAHALDNSPTGGITGFQAGAIQWEFIRHWDSLNGPARILKYETMLYPQYADAFSGVSAETWAWVQAEAQKKLDEHPDRGSHWLTDHWRSIVAGQVPFGLKVGAS